ncbi:hypothetical protein MKZ38_000192 [Zalerion maritima]|uniref:Uncharacterized protein n=1 Tax=Zalerion maritima TaxID=339359 RepID=A0AAD5WMR0_9PEZI|nr:hypothetical protein MKZ38_000192 [Zalerion maritima]
MQHHNEDGCVEWGAGRRVFLCGHEEVVEAETFTLYCSAAEAAEDKSCGKEPKKPSLGTTRLDEPCEDCKETDDWEQREGVWERKE